MYCSSCRTICFSACLFKDTSSPGNKIGTEYEYNENVESISDCQSRCKFHHDNNKVNKSCDYFTYYDKKCILKTAKARWNLLYNQGKITGTRDCTLDQTNGMY